MARNKGEQNKDIANIGQEETGIMKEKLAITECVKGIDLEQQDACQKLIDTFMEHLQSMTGRTTLLQTNSRAVLLDYIAYVVDTLFENAFLEEAIRWSGMLYRIIKKEQEEGSLGAIRIVFPDVDLLGVVEKRTAENICHKAMNEDVSYVELVLMCHLKYVHLNYVVEWCDLLEKSTYVENEAVWDEAEQEKKRIDKKTEGLMKRLQNVISIGKKTKKQE